MTKKCSNCDYAICQDVGYSNYSVEGTTVHCTLALNPNGPFDRWYGEDESDKYAENCDKFCDEEGPAFLDCELEDFCRDSDGPNCWVKYATKKVPAEKLIEILG